jgi:hypothetical protein
VNTAWQELGLAGPLSYPTQGDALAARLAQQRLALPPPDGAPVAAAVGADETEEELQAALDDQDELQMLGNVDMDSGVGM